MHWSIDIATIYLELINTMPIKQSDNSRFPQKLMVFLGRGPWLDSSDEYEIYIMEQTFIQKRMLFVTSTMIILTVHQLICLASQVVIVTMSLYLGDLDHYFSFLVAHKVPSSIMSVSLYKTFEKSQINSLVIHI